MSDDNPYELLADDDLADQRWAFGTGFTDALAGIDTRVPEGLDADALAEYCLMLGDDALIYSHRLQQWITRMPELEEETALANIALDLLGQARMLLARAGAIVGRSEDELAYFRDEEEFRNVRLVEHRDADFAELAVRLLLFTTWRLELFDQLRSCADPVVAAIAGKGVNELTYHRDYAAQWVIRLGDGTGISHGKVQRAVTRLWPLAGELFGEHPADFARTDRDSFDVVIASVFATAGVERPVLDSSATIVADRGRDGVHTEELGHVLAELQSVARAHPDATW